MSLKTFYWKTRTLLSGDYREIERNIISSHNQRIIKKYSKKGPMYGVLRIYTDEGGLFCLYLKVLGGIQYCIEHDLIPVVDMQTKINIFQTKSERKKLNTWELFFEQPAGISYNEIKNQKNKVIIENPSGPSIASYMDENPKAHKYWKYIAQNYILFNSEMKNIISKYASDIFDGSKVLGVMLRGTDYTRKTAMSHAIQPDVKTVISEIKDVIEKYSFNKIFLASEDKKLFDTITKEFGEIVYSIPQKRFDEEITDKLGHRKDYATYAKEMNKSYLASIAILSKCNGFIAGMTGGSFGTWLMADNYEYLHIYSLGSFGCFDDETCDFSRLDAFEKKMNNLMK